MAFSQPHFRIRNGDAAGINADTDWLAALDTNGSQPPDKLFRLRFEVESDSAISSAFKMQYRRNAGTWRDCPANNYTGNVDKLDVAYVSAQYNDGVATSNLLSGSGLTFVAGDGNENNLTASITFAANNHSEFEFTCVIHKLYNTSEDSPVWGFNSTNDTFDFRLVQSDGTVFTGSYVNPVITLSNKSNFVGGTCPETPGFFGPVRDDNGNLYTMVEHGNIPTQIIPCMLKSSDGGISWTPQDDTDWATISDSELESLDFHYLASLDQIFTGQQGSSDPWFRIFNTSAHATPDAFAIAPERPVNLSAVADQTAGIVRRSDGTVVHFYVKTVTNNRLFYIIRSSGGTWGGENDLEVEAGIDWQGVRVCIGASDLIHIVYAGTSTAIYYRNLNSSDTLSGRTSLTTSVGTTVRAPALKPVYYDDAGAEKITLIYYKSTDSKLYSRVVTNGSVGSESAAAIVGNTVRAHIASSLSPCAFVAVDSVTKTVYVAYADNTTFDLYEVHSISGGSWTSDVEIADGITVDIISGSLFTHSSANGGSKVLGWIVADTGRGPSGVAGYTGDMFYGEYILQLGSVFPFTEPFTGSDGSAWSTDRWATSVAG